MTTFLTCEALLNQTVGHGRQLYFEVWFGRFINNYDNMIHVLCRRPVTGLSETVSTHPAAYV
jgi:hypothetical protein